MAVFTVTYPLDLTKTRLQIQGEQATKVELSTHQPYRGMIKTVIGIGMSLSIIVSVFCFFLLL